MVIEFYKSLLKTYFPLFLSVIEDGNIRKVQHIVYQYFTASLIINITAFDHHPQPFT